MSKLCCRHAEGFKCMILLNIEIIGACFQAPHATPGPRPMETFILNIFMPSGN